MRLSFLMLCIIFISSPVYSQEKGISIIKDLMDEADIPGMSMAKFRGENLQFIELGYKNIKTLEPIERNTMFQAASLTKVIIATLCLQLYEKKKINLSEPLWRTVPYPKLEGDKRARKITPRMVLSHTTGLPNWGKDKIILKNAPGTTFGYSGEAFVWLGMVLEKLSGKSLEDLAQEQIFDPLEMQNTSLSWKKEYVSQATSAYNEIELEESYNRFEKVNAAASLWTTARDYAIFMQALLSAKVLRWTSMTLMFNPRVSIEDTEDQLHWGYGIGLQFVNKRKALWHWGDNRLFRCFVFAYPDTKEGFVFFTNSENGLSFLNKFLQMQYPGFHPLVKWLDYLDYQSESLKARKELKLAFMYKDSSEALKVYERIHSSSPEAALQFGSSTYQLLRNQREYERALPLLRRQLRSKPTDALYWERYADALSKTHRYLSARQAYKRVIAAAPDQYFTVKNKFRWLEEGIKAQKNKKSVSNLQAYAGQYHDVQISLTKGQLWSQSFGQKTSLRLIPINESIFEVDGPVTYRYKFEIGDKNNIEGLVIYGIDGMINYYPKK